MKKNSISKILILILILMMQTTQIAYGVVQYCTDHICAGNGQSAYAQGHNNRHEVDYSCTDPTHTFTTQMYCWTCAETRYAPNENGWHDYICLTCGKRKNTGGQHNTLNACPECGQPHLSCSVCGHTIIHKCAPDTTLTDAIPPILKDSTVVYDGNAHTVLMTGGSGGTIYYSATNNGTDWTTTIPSRIDVGTTTVYAFVRGDDTHNDSSVVSATITITKQDITPTVTNNGYIYGETVSTPSVAGNTGSGTVTYYYRKAGTTNWLNWTNVTSATYLAPGEYQMYANVAATANYNGADTGIITFMVSKPSPTPVISMTGYSYGGTKTNPSLTSGNPENGTVTYYYNTTNSNINGMRWSDVSSSTSLNVGTYYMYAIVGATANYNSATSATVAFTISKGERTGANQPVLDISDYTYESAPMVPAIENNLENGTVSYWYTTTQVTTGGTQWNNITPTTLNAGDYYLYARVGETANYQAGTSESKKFTVKKHDSVLPTITDYIGDYDGEAHTITVANNAHGGIVKFSSDGTTWTDTPPTYTEPTDTSILIHVVGDANHFDSDDINGRVKINKKALNTPDLSITVTPETTSYTGAAITPTVVVKHGETTLVSGTDYTLTYSNNVHAGTATVTITGAGGYDGIVNRQFTITPVTLTVTGPNVTMAYGDEIPEIEFSFSGQKGDDEPKLRGVYQTLASSEAPLGVYDIDRGTLELDPVYIVPGDYIINYVKGTITITPMSIASSQMVCDISPLEYTYDGTEKKPNVRLYRAVSSDRPLVEGTDYTVVYSNNKNAGTASIVITASGSWTGTLNKTFEIKKRVLTIIPDNVSKLYGQPDPALTYTYVNNVDGEIPGFTGALSRQAGEGIGTYSILQNTLQPTNSDTFNIDNYTVEFAEGQIFSIRSATINGLSATLSQNEFYYDGNAHTPEVTVTNSATGNALVRGLDYSLSYSNNINVGTAIAKVTGINNYTGVIELPFTILQPSITGSVSIVANSDTPCSQDILSAEVTVTPTENVVLSYQWYTNTTDTTDGGTAITGATMNRLVLTEDMINKYIYVVVEARRQNYISATFKDSLGVKVKERQAPSAPAITAKLNNSTGADYVSGSWTNQNVWIGLRSEDNFGILRYEFSSTSQSEGFVTIGSVTNNQASLLMNTDTNKVTYYFRCIDIYNNVSEVSSIVVAIDKVTPIIQNISKDVTSWTNNKVTVTGHITDNMSGVAGYYFGSTNTGVFNPVGPELDMNVSKDYSQNVNDYYLVIVDQAGNTASANFTIDNIDKTQPSLRISETKTPSDVTWDITVADNQSGIDKVTLNGKNIEINPQGQDYVGSVTINEGGDYNLVVTDMAGNRTTFDKTFYSIIYSTNGVSGNIPRQIKEAGEDLTIRACNIINSEYEFVKWNTEEDGSGRDYIPGVIYSADESIILYAQWSSISYNLFVVELDDYSLEFSGTEITPSEKVYNNYGQLLQRGEDYEVSYENNINVGEANVIITGLNKYDGETLRTSFLIYGQSIEGMNITIEPEVFVYDGYAKEPKVTIKYGNDTLVQGRDYDLRYEDNINAGTAKAIITARGSYYGVAEVSFTITKADRNLYTYNIGMIKGERLEVKYSYQRERVNDTLVSNDEEIVTIERTATKYYINAIKEGSTTITYTVPEDDNYNAAERTMQVTVYKDKESARPIYGKVIIDKGAEETVTPRTLLDLYVSCADYMYISTENTQPNADSDGWYDFSSQMPIVFDETEGTKTIYVWFKDDNGNVSDVATDSIVLNYSYEYPAHDQIMLDKTEVNKAQPEVEFTDLLPEGITIDIVFKQKDVMVNDTRSGVDPTTIKYGYKEKNSTGDYIWSEDNSFTGLSFGESYVIVTQSRDRAGNGPTISDEFEFVTPTKFTTTLTLSDTNAPCDGLVHEIDEVDVEIIGGHQPTGTITYTYYIDRNCTIKTTPERDGSQSVGSAPSRGATYYVKAELTNDPVYHDAISNVGKLHIGWYIDRGSDWTQNVFAYVEELASTPGKYELTVVGEGYMKDMSALIAKDPDPKLSYWAEYVDDIQVLTLGDEESNILNIGAEVFSGLTGISEIILPETIVEIGDRAFAGDNGVTNNILIPGTVEKIGTNPFVDVKTREFEVLYGNQKYDTVDGVLVTKDHVDLIAYPGGRTQTTYTIPDEVLIIKTSAFEDADILENVIIHDKVKQIGAKAFYNCDNLRQIEIFDLKDDDIKDLYNIGDDSFMNIAEESEIYTYSKSIADMLIADRDYNQEKTKVYWPPVITLQPIDMFGGIGQTVKFIVEAESGYIDELHFEWYKQTGAQIKPGEDSLVVGGTTNSPTPTTSEYTTPSITMANNGDKYYCVAWNMPYYRTRGYAHSTAGTVQVLSNANYRVERQIESIHSTNNYYFETLEEAFTFSESGDNIRVIKNVTNEGNATLSGNKKVTFTNDSKTVTMAGTLVIESGATLEMNGAGSFEKASTNYILNNSGNLIMNNTALTFRNTAGPGMNLLEGSELTINAGTINTTGTAISANSATITMTSTSSRVVVNSPGNVNGIEINNYTKLNIGNGSIEVRSTSTSADKVVAIFNNARDDVNEGKGRITINQGTVKAIGSGTATGDAIVNANSADLVINGGIIDGTRSAIENVTSNNFGDVRISKGQIQGGYYGIINNAHNAVIIVGNNDQIVSTSEPRISGGKIALFDASNGDRLEFYDGVFTTQTIFESRGNSNIIYETLSNTSLNIDPTIQDMVYIESGRNEIKTEEEYSIYASVESGRNNAVLRQGTTPTPSNVSNATVEEGEQATFEVSIVTPGHPDSYEYEWQVSIDGGVNWNRITSGSGMNTNKYTTSPASMGMNGNLYRCKITNRTGIVYTNSALLTVLDETLYKDKRPFVSVIYRDGHKFVNYDDPSDTSSDKYVNMQIIIKSFAPLESAKFSYATERDRELLGIGTLYRDASPEESFEIKEQAMIQVRRTEDIVEYTYTWDLQAFKNGIVTINAVDTQKRERTDSQTIDALFDLKVDYEKSSLSDTNNKLTVTFYSNKPVHPYASSTEEGSTEDFRLLKSTNGSTYSYKFLLTPTQRMPATRYYFEDEYNNRTYIEVEEMIRIAYRDVRFTGDTSDGTKINDMSIVEAYNVAQKLEAETEINGESAAQSRYGLSQVQADMFMARARDVGAAEMLSRATSAMSYDGYYVREIDAVQPVNDVYNYKSNTRNNYTAAVVGGTNSLSKESSNYVDKITNSNLYMGADISTFRLDSTQPYMYEDLSGRAVNINNDIKDASFRAVIVNN